MESVEDMLKAIKNGNKEYFNQQRVVSILKIRKEYSHRRDPKCWENVLLNFLGNIGYAQEYDLNFGDNISLSLNKAKISGEYGGRKILERVGKELFMIESIDDDKKSGCEFVVITRLQSFDNENDVFGKIVAFFVKNYKGSIMFSILSEDQESLKVSDQKSGCLNVSLFFGFSIIGFLFLFTSCTKKIDGSSQKTYDLSVVEIGKSLNDKRKLEFLTALATIELNICFSDSSNVNAKQKAENAHIKTRKLLDGKTAQQAIQEAKRLKESVHKLK